MRIAPVPERTNGGAPRIGASTRVPPAARTCVSRSATRSGPAVLMSTKCLPAPAVSAPSGPRYAASTASGPVRLLMMISASRAASAGVSTTVPRPRASARDRVRFQSTTSEPVSDNRAAMAEPILPVPRMAILCPTGVLLSVIGLAPWHRFGGRAANGDVGPQDGFDLRHVAGRQDDLGRR